MTLAAIIAAGLFSRTVTTGWIVFDKYLGDALYAAMIYELIRLGSTWHRRRVAAWAAFSMLTIEMFQLTGVPAAMVASRSPAAKIAGRLLGTHFSFLDLAAYAAGLILIYYWYSWAGSGSK